MAYQVFAVTPATNSDDKCDATGAFIPGAQRFAHAYNGSFRAFDNVGSLVKKNFLKTIEDGPGSLDMFAYFGHGYKTQLGSANNGLGRIHQAWGHTRLGVKSLHMI